MAYTITGRIKFIGAVKTIQTRTGNTTIATPSPTPAPKPRPNTGAEGASYPPVPANPYAGAPQPAQQGQYGNSQTNYEAPPF